VNHYFATGAIYLAGNITSDTLSSYSVTIPAPLLSIRSATVIKNGTTILNDLSLEIAEGEHTAILGPNGSGKSSLIKILTREHYPLAHPSGDPVVRIFGQDRWDVSTLRTLLGIVSSDVHHLFTRSNGVAGSGMTGAEAVLSGAFGSVGLGRNHPVTSEMRTQARTALTLMDALPLADKPMDVLSTGEARRILIARALVSDPRALLLDEPTTGLDLLASRHFLDSIRSLAQNGKTVLLVTHHIQEILPEIQRVILIKNGRIFRDGTKAEVLTGEALSELYEASVQVQRNAFDFYSAEAV
jgi:iron complex transport system ATP-binding protein